MSLDSPGLKSNTQLSFSKTVCGTDLATPNNECHPGFEEYIDMSSGIRYVKSPLVSERKTMKKEWIFPPNSHIIMHLHYHRVDREVYRMIATCPFVYIMDVLVKQQFVHNVLDTWFQPLPFSITITVLWSETCYCKT